MLRYSYSDFYESCILHFLPILITNIFTILLTVPLTATHIRPGAILLAIKLPTMHVTFVAFGGPDLDILFLTTTN